MFIFLNYMEKAFSILSIVLSFALWSDESSDFRFRCAMCQSKKCTHLYITVCFLAGLWSFEIGNGTCGIFVFSCVKNINSSAHLNCQIEPHWETTKYRRSFSRLSWYSLFFIRIFSTEIKCLQAVCWWLAHTLLQNKIK